MNKNDIEKYGIEKFNNVCQRNCMEIMKMLLVI